MYNESRIKFNSVKYMLVFFTMYNLMSCSYITENKDHLNKADRIEKIAINKEEARLLVRASKISLDVINLSQKVLWNNFELSKMALNFEKEHTVIYNYLNNIAKEKLILIPSIIVGSQNDNIAAFGDNNLTQNYNESIALLLKEQLDIMDKLYNATTDIDFRVLVVKINTKLKIQLDQVESNR